MKSVGTQFNIQFQRQMGVFKASIDGSFSVSQRLIPHYEKFYQRSGGGSDLRFGSKPGTSKQTDTLPPNTRPQPNTQLSELTDEPM